MILGPGATIGILGSGQLGRMLAIAALKVGLRTHIFAPEAEAPAYDAAAGANSRAFRRRRGARAVSPKRSTSSPTNSRTCRSKTVEFLGRARTGAARRAGAGADPGPAGRKDLPARSGPEDRALRRRRGRRRARARGRRTRPPGDPEDPAVRLRRQGPVADPRGLERRRGPSGAGLGADDSRRLRRLRARGLGRRRAQPRGGDRRLRPQRERAREAHPRQNARAGAGQRRDSGSRRGGSQARSSRRSTMSACSRSNSS